MVFLPLQTFVFSCLLQGFWETLGLVIMKAFKEECWALKYVSSIFVVVYCDLHHPSLTRVKWRIYMCVYVCVCVHNCVVHL